MNIGICSSSAPFTGMVRDLPRRALVKASVCAANCTLSLHQATGERRKSQTTPIVQRSDSPWLRKRMKETGFHLDGFRDYETHRKIVQSVTSSAGFQSNTSCVLSQIISNTKLRQWKFPCLPRGGLRHLTNRIDVVKLHAQKHKFQLLTVGLQRIRSRWTPAGHTWELCIVNILKRHFKHL